MRIIITGTPGTGKSSIGKKLAKYLGYKVYETSYFCDKNIMVGYDKRRKCKIIDEKNLSKRIENFIKNKNNIVIIGHLAHYINPKYIDLCIVTKCNLRVLYNRLKKRGYNRDKIKENLEVEIFDICYNECLENGFKKDKIFIFFTHRGRSKESWDVLKKRLRELKNKI